MLAIGVLVNFDHAFYLDPLMKDKNSSMTTGLSNNEKLFDLRLIRHEKIVINQFYRYEMDFT